MTTTGSATRSLDRRVLLSAGVPAVIVGVIGAVLGSIVVGSKGTIGAALGTVIVVIFFSVGQLALGHVIRTNPQLALTVAMMVYLIKVGVLLILLIVLQGSTLFDPKVFGLTIVACTLAWTIGEVWVFATAKVLYVDPSEGPR